MGRLVPDLCVIGGGPAGIHAATTAAALGARVVLVERGRIGGLSLHGGSVSMRALAAAAARAQAMRDGAPLGVGMHEPEIDFAAVRRHVAAAVAAASTNCSPERLRALGIQVLAAEARFSSAGTVIAGDSEIAARGFVIAAGSRPVVPAAPGLDGVDYLTPETVFALERRPRHLVILGGGDSGIETAQAFRRLGSNVTVVEFGTPLSRWDPELAAVVLRRLRREGVVIRDNAKVMGMDRTGRGHVRVQIKWPAGVETYDASHVLLAAGRRPDLAGLGLVEAGIVEDGNGISVDDRLVTANPRVFAIGDCIGECGNVALARHHAEVAVSQLVERKRASEEGWKVPRSLGTDPGIAEVGLTEAEARRRGIAFRILRAPFADGERALAERCGEGHLKLLLDDSHRLLGAGLAGAGAAELMDTWALALSAGLGLQQIAAHASVFPSFGGICKNAAMAYLLANGDGKAGPILFGRRLRR